jgi:hypothetical protein
LIKKAVQEKALEDINQDETITKNIYDTNSNSSHEHRNNLPEIE